MRIIMGRFNWNGSREEYEKEAMRFAKNAVGMPGLVWKLWFFDEEKSEAMGLYYFKNNKAAKIHFEAIDPTTWPENCSNIEVKMWEVMEEHCRVNNGPI